jgi:hypothetical protein
MGGIIAAWLIGEGMVIWRWSKAGAPPTPGALALSSGFFVLCGVLATYQPARGVAAGLAFGIDVAALLQVLPGSKVAPDQMWPPAQMENSATTLLPGGNPTAGSQTFQGSTTAATTPPPAAPPAGTPDPVLL